MRYNDETRLAAVVLARQIGVDAAAEFLSLNPSTLKLWVKQWGQNTYLAPLSNRALELIAGHIIDALNRLIPALTQSDTSRMSTSELAVVIGILVDKLAVLATASTFLAHTDNTAKEDVVTAIKSKLGLTTTYEPLEMPPAEIPPAPPAGMPPESPAAQSPAPPAAQPPAPPEGSRPSSRRRQKP